MSILVGYATRYESTREVAEAVGETLEGCGLGVEVRPLREVRSLDGYDAVVMGAPLFMFRWHKDALRFLSRFRDALQERPVAVFALGPVHDPHDEEEWQDSWSQLNKALAKYPLFTPTAVEMFGGRYDSELLRFPIKQLAGDEPATDIRDWEAIGDWVKGVAGMLGQAGG